MMIRTVINKVEAITSQFIPQQLRMRVFAKFGGLFGKLSAQMTLHIDEFNGLSIDETYQAISTEAQNSYFDPECYSQFTETSERKMVQHSFHKRFKDEVFESQKRNW